MRYERFPFNSNHPIGYLIAVILEYIIIGYENGVNTCTLSLGIGIFWIIIASTKRIKHILHKIDDHKTRTNKNYSNKFEQLAEIVHAHKDLKQLSKNFMKSKEVGVIFENFEA